MENAPPSFRLRRGFRSRIRHIVIPIFTLNMPIIINPLRWAPVSRVPLQPVS